MKKAIIVLVSVAILGGLGGFFLTRDGHDKTAVAGSESSSTQKQARDRSVAANHYPDGRYTGDLAETLYGNVQIAIVISGGRISEVQYLHMPDVEDGRSRQLTEMAKPRLTATTLDKQSDKIDFVTGATSTSFGYQESLQAALDAAFQAS